MGKVQLKVMGLADTKSASSVSLLMLEEVNGYRKLPLLISDVEAQSILIAIKNHPLERPLTHDLMKTLIRDMQATVRQAYIYKLEGEVYYAYLIIEQNNRQIILDSRPSDAIAITVRLNAPIYVEEEILDQFQGRIKIIHSDNAPLEVLSLDELEDRMHKAVDAEDYELAAKVRDEIKNREK